MLPTSPLLPIALGGLSKIEPSKLKEMRKRERERLQEIKGTKE